MHKTMRVQQDWPQVTVLRSAHDRARTSDRITRDAQAEAAAKAAREEPTAEEEEEDSDGNEEFEGLG